MAIRPSPPDRRFRRSVVGHLWHGTKSVARGPIDAVGPREIARGASLIRALLEVLQRDSRADGLVRVDEHGHIDLVTTAFMCGVTPAVLEERLSSRRRETKRAAYALFILGTLTFVGWLLEVLNMRMSTARIMSAVEFLPFSLFLFLSAFRYSWFNWQLRTRRLDSAAAYLRTNEPFLPS